MDKNNKTITNKETLKMNTICMIRGHKLNYDFGAAIGAPTTSSFVFNPEASNQNNLVECLRGMVNKYCDRDENDLPKPSEEQRCPCVAGAQRLIYGIEFHQNPSPF